MKNKELSIMQQAAIEELFGIKNAYGIGISGTDGSYTVDIDYKKPKRYVLPMEGTEDEFGSIYAMAEKGHWNMVRANTNITNPTGLSVTQAEIDSAPAWVKAITPVEVHDERD